MATVSSNARRGRVATVVTTGSAALVVFTALGFFGDIHPLFDTLAQARLHVCILLLLLVPILFLLRSRSLALSALAMGGLGLYTAIPFLPIGSGQKAEPGTPVYTLLQMNLRFDAPKPEAALSLIARLHPDVVTLEELTPLWMPKLKALEPSYPYQFYCKEPFLRGDVAILSRRPFVDSSAIRPGDLTVCEGQYNFAAKTIDFNGLAVTVGAEHLRWPWPGRQPSMVAGMKTVLPRLADPLIIAGDFNAAPWSANMRAYAKASRTRIVGGIGPTFMKDILPPELGRWVGLPIDNILVSDGVTVLKVERPLATTSDHLPVLLTFTMRFAVPDEPEVRSASR